MNDYVGFHTVILSVYMPGFDCHCATKTHVISKQYSDRCWVIMRHWHNGHGASIPWSWQRPVWYGPLARCENCRLRMCRECQERFPRHCGLAILTCITAHAWRTCRDAYRDCYLAASFEVSGGEETFPAFPEPHSIQRILAHDCLKTTPRLSTDTMDGNLSRNNMKPCTYRDWNLLLIGHCPKRDSRVLFLRRTIFLMFQ